MELPTQAALDRLAPDKRRVTIEATMSEVRGRLDSAREDARTMAHPLRFAPAGQTTQMVVGAGESTDADMLATAAELYQRHLLRRVYYSAFSPIPRGARALRAEAPPLMGEHRLYQADWLVRHYGFSAHELTTSAQPNLEIGLNPKLAWALRHPELFPVDLNAAPREALLRVPGIGYRAVQRLLRIRRHHRLTVHDLRKLRVRLSDARHFIVTQDSRPATPAHAERFARPVQLLLL